MLELYKKYLNGEKFKRISDLDLLDLSINQPSDLVGSSKIMQDIAKKHSKNLQNNKTRLL